MDKLFLGINHHVVCINKKSGEEIWKTKIKSSSLTNVYYEDNQIFAYSGGHLFCLNADDGAVLWENPLKGFGYGHCIMASDSQNASVITSQVAAQQANAIAATVAVSASTNSNN